MSDALNVQLEQISGACQEEDLITRFTNIIVTAAAEGRHMDFDFALQFVLGENVQSADVAVQVILNLVTVAKELPVGTFHVVAARTLQILKNFRGRYDPYDFDLRNALFESHLREGQYRDAAAVLSGVYMESVTYPLTDEDKADILIKCAECFLVIDESVDAESFVNRASVLINNVPAATAVNLRFRTLFARVLDANRKFLDAALRYYELSTTNILQVAREDLFVLLSKAIVCAILGKGCVQRDRIIGLLSKDLRLAELQQIPEHQIQVNILLKIDKKQIIRPDEFAVFEKSLMNHHKAVASYGQTIPQRTLMEHNILAISNVYDNIRIEDLGRILQVDTPIAEKLAAKMIIDKTVVGFIDQEAGIIDFCVATGDETVMTAWNNSIKTICQSVSDCAEMAASKH